MVEKKKIKIKTKKKKSVKSKNIEQTQNQKAIQKVNINIDPSIIKGRTPIKRKPVNKKNISQNALNAILSNASYPPAQAYEFQKLQNDILKRDLKDYIKGRISNVTPPLLIENYKDSSSYGNVKNIKPAKNTVEIEEYGSEYINQPSVGSESEPEQEGEPKQETRPIRRIKIIKEEVKQEEPKQEEPKQEEPKQKRERAKKGVVELRRELITYLIAEGMSRSRAEKQAKEIFG